MGLFLQQNGQRSQLQEQIAAELQEKLHRQPEPSHDEVEPRFMENQHQTRYAGILISIMVIAAIIIALFIAANPPK